MQNFKLNNATENKEQNPEALKWLEGSLHLSKSVPDWVTAMRSTGYEVFAEVGFPTLKIEDWKYTNLRSLLKEEFHFSNIATAFTLPERLSAENKRVVLVNGRFSKELSDKIDGVEAENIIDSRISRIEEYLVTVGDLRKEPFKALNAAYMQEGVVLKINKTIKHNIEVVFYNSGDGAAIYPRNLYWLGKDAKAHIIERYTGNGKYFFNSYTAIVQEEYSKLKFYRLEEESENAFHFSSVYIQQHKSSEFEGFSYASGAVLAREEFKMDLVDEHAVSNIGGLYMIRENQSHDFKVLTQHLEPHCNSTQTFRGVVDDKASAVFQGKVYVARNAQKTDAAQINRSILLSPNAKANFKPELEIYADDVKCSHGATSGQIDNEALFYMQSRGIPEAEARSMLVQAFLSETLEKVTDEGMRQVFEGKIKLWLNK